MLNTRTKALIFGFVFSVIVSMLNFSGKCESISEKILRLHIIANSDSCEDQTLKLKVRDEIINKFGSELEVYSNLEEAKQVAESKINEIEDFAASVVHESGYDYSVKAEVTKMYFNIRRYKEVTLPAGFYTALRITIGQGTGKNWWCVMFPPMCLPAAEEKSELSEVLSDSQLDIVENEGEYIIKLKALEIFIEAKKFCEEKIYNFINSVFEHINENYELDFKLAELIQKFFN